MVTTRPPKTIVKPTAIGPVANTDTKLLIYGLFQKGRVLAQDDISERRKARSIASCPKTQTIAACWSRWIQPAMATTNHAQGGACAICCW